MPRVSVITLLPALMGYNAFIEYAKSRLGPANIPKKIQAMADSSELDEFVSSFVYNLADYIDVELVAKGWLGSFPYGGEVTDITVSKLGPLIWVNGIEEGDTGYFETLEEAIRDAESRYCGMIESYRINHSDEEE